MPPAASSNSSPPRARNKPSPPAQPSSREPSPPIRYPPSPRVGTTPELPTHMPPTGPASRTRCYPAVRNAAAGRVPLMMMMPEHQPVDHNNDRDQKHENGNAIDPMHILHPLRMRCVRITLLDVEILPDLSPNSHGKMLEIQRSGVSTRPPNVKFPAKVNNKGIF